MHTRNPEQATEGAASASDPLAEARRVVAADEQARMQACAEEIQAVLAKHGMRLDVSQPQITSVPNS